jgi:hypothetical protein
MMIIWWSKHVGVILSVLVCDVWINVLLQTSALVGPLYIVNWNAGWNSERNWSLMFTWTSTLHKVTLHHTLGLHPILLASALVWAEKSSGDIWYRSTWTGGRPVKVVAIPRTYWVELCQVEQKSFKTNWSGGGAVSRSRNPCSHLVQTGTHAEAGLPTVQRHVNAVCQCPAEPWVVCSWGPAI